MLLKVVFNPHNESVSVEPAEDVITVLCGNAHGTFDSSLRITSMQFPEMPDAVQVQQGVFEALFEHDAVAIPSIMDVVVYLDSECTIEPQLIARHILAWVESGGLETAMAGMLH